MSNKTGLQIVREFINEVIKEWDSSTCYESAEVIEEMHKVLDKITEVEKELQSRPVGDVEGYLEGKKLINSTGFHSNKSLWEIKYFDAIAALQALARDKDAEIEKWFEIAQSELNKKINLACQVSDLTAEVERLKGGWISVDERLPKKGQLVLGTYVEKDQHQNDVWVCAVEYKGKWYRKPRWVNQFQDETVFVTHWQPLPLPPNPQQ